MPKSIYKSMSSEKSFTLEQVRQLINKPFEIEMDFTNFTINKKPEWPIEKSQYASAGELAAVYKSCLDDWEPLVGLVSERMPDGPRSMKELLARAHMLALAHLTMISIGKIIQSSGHPYSFYDYTAFTRFHFAVLDQIGQLKSGQGQVSNLLGWNAESGFNYEQYDIWKVDETRKEFAKIFDEIAEDYPDYPVTEFVESGIEKMIHGYSQKVGLSSKQAFRVLGWEPEGTIEDWSLYTDSSLTDFSEYAKEKFQEVVDVLVRSTSEFEARLIAFKHFLPAFDEPYSFEDVELWQWMLSNGLIWGKKNVKGYDENGDFSELYTRFSSLNDLSVLGPAPEYLELLEKDWGSSEFPQVDSDDDAVQLAQLLADFGRVAQGRHHLPTTKQVQEMEGLVSTYAEEITVRLCSKAQRKIQLADGSLLNEVNLLIGMDEIKSSMLEYLSLAANDSPTAPKIKIDHIVLTGNPGTGKTTVARLLGKVFEAMGLLSSGQVNYVTRADLVAPYTGQTAPKVAEAVKNSLGGVLFIDEAYSLSSSGLSESDNFGREAIDELIVQMENNRGQFLVIAAGYPGEMERFLNTNPGMRSRFGVNWNIPDYSVSELWGIFNHLAKEDNIELAPGLKAAFDVLTIAAKKKDNFSNGRWVRNLLGEATKKKALRLRNDATAANRLEHVDLIDEKSNKKFDEENLKLALDEINSMVGLGDIKDQIEEVVAVQKVRLRRIQEGLPELQPKPNHLIFSGPPGTGKTTVAKMLGNVFKSLGLLSSGHVVETQRSDLVAGYIGQTAIKTAEVFSRAEGGILFIDEAYTLTKVGSSDANDFGQEAVDTLLKLMEDNRDDTVVIAAGYENKMEQFIQSNPGLSSRFGKTIRFSAWNANQLFDVVRKELEKIGFEIEPEGIEFLKDASNRIANLPTFASGRTARRFIEEIQNSQSVRIFKTDSASLVSVEASDIERASEKMVGTLKESDISW